MALEDIHVRSVSNADTEQFHTNDLILDIFTADMKNSSMFEPLTAPVVSN